MVAEDRRRPATVRLIVERANYEFGAKVRDHLDRECLVGLTSVETEEYLLLQKMALHGDDENFRRYIELGDRHEQALIQWRKLARAPDSDQ